MRGALAGLGIVVTRPAHQAEGLCRLIEADGGRAIRFPVLEIVEPRDTAPLLAAIDALERFHVAIFISPNAVERAMNLIRARRGGLPEGLLVAAIGRGSARALRTFGVEPHVYPRRRFDSEALLALPELAPERLAGRRVVIFRGEGGREHLGDVLRARGAEVTYAEAYRRVRPRGDVGRLLKAWARGEIHAIVVTSGEGLRNLYDMVGKLGRAWLRATPLVVVSERMVQLAAELGFRHPPVVAEAASDEAILEALRRWRAGGEA